MPLLSSLWTLTQQGVCTLILPLRFGEPHTARVSSLPAHLLRSYLNGIVAESCLVLVAFARGKLGSNTACCSQASSGRRLEGGTGPFWRGVSESKIQQ